MKYLLVIIAFLILSCLAISANAFDFYGAAITDRDVPSSYMRHGIHGFKPIINSVAAGSPAKKAGFAQGDIILSVNGNNIKNVSEMGAFTADLLDVLVFSRIERKVLTINRAAIEKEKADKVSAKTKYIEEQATVVSSIKYDNEALDNKYGKSVAQDSVAFYAARYNELLRLATDPNMPLISGSQKSRAMSALEVLRKERESAAIVHSLPASARYWELLRVATDPDTPLVSGSPKDRAMSALEVLRKERESTANFRSNR